MNTTRALLWLVIPAAIAAGAPQEPKTLADLYKTGSVRFVPEITITDEAMGGKEYFSGPGDMAVGSDGRVFLCDRKSNHIKVFDSAGRFRGTIGKAGQGPGDFNYPAEVEYAAGRLYVRELMNMRLSVLDPEGKYLLSIPIDFGAGSWQKIRALPDGRLVVEKEKVDRGNLEAPQVMALDLYSKDLVFLKRLYEREIRKNRYVTEPISINVPIPYPAVVHWEVTADGCLVVGYSGNYEVELIDPDRGKTPLLTGSYTPVVVTEAEKEAFFRGLVFGTLGPAGESPLRKGAPDWVVKTTQFPRFKPAFSGLLVDGEGNIWVRAYPSAPKDPSRFDAFDPKGRFLGRVAIRDGLVPYYTAMRPGGFWGLAIGEDEEYSIVFYRIAD